MSQLQNIKHLLFKIRPIKSMMTRFLMTLLTLAMLYSCLGESVRNNEEEEEDPSPTPRALTPPEYESNIAKLQAYSTCEEDADCEGLACREVLGSKVCVKIGCKEEGNDCSDGEKCIVSENIEPSGLCARTGAYDYCGSNCRNTLVCSLSSECIKQGCCSDVTEGGCPVTCSELGKMECEITPQCPAECCS